MESSLLEHNKTTQENPLKVVHTQPILSNHQGPYPTSKWKGTTRELKVGVQILKHKNSRLKRYFIYSSLSLNTEDLEESVLLRYLLKYILLANLGLHTPVPVSGLTPTPTAVNPVQGKLWSNTIIYQLLFCI